MLHQRHLATHDLLGELFNVTPMTTSRAARNVLPVLTAHGYQITASTARFRTPGDITTFLSPEATGHPNEIKPAC